MPVLDIGDRFIQNFLERYPKDQQQAILESFADPKAIELNAHIAQFAELTFMALARLENVSAELLTHTRIQAMTLRSVFTAIALHGQKMAAEEHPLMQVESEEADGDE